MNMQTSKSGESEPSGLIEAKTNTEIIDSVFDLTPDDVERLKKKKPKLLGIVCSRSDCKRELHCFDSSRSKVLKFPPGRCQSCGVDLIDWEVTHVKDVRNIDVKFDYFRKEWIRHFFFHVPITPRIQKYARKYGFTGLAQIVEHQLTQGKMLRFIPALDWNQTKMLDGTIVHWARHATASCCRACMRYWHNIPFEHELTSEDIQYLKELAMRYIELRMPELKTSATKTLVDEHLSPVEHVKVS